MSGPTGVCGRIAGWHAHEAELKLSATDTGSKPVAGRAEIYLSLVRVAALLRAASLQNKTVLVAFEP